MEKYQQMIKLFFMLFICTAFIFTISYFGPKFTAKNNTVVQQPSESSAKTGKSLKTNTASSQQEKSVILNETAMNVDGMANNLQTFLERNAKIEIPPQTSFSLIRFVKNHNLENVDQDTLSIIATGIYQTILPSNFTIEERNISSDLPSYAKLGYEAKMNIAENEDLIFSNPNKTSYILELSLNGDTLHLDLKGEKFPYEYKISMGEEQQFEPKTIVQYSPILLQGQSVITDAGRSGQTVNIYREDYQGKILVNSEFIANDYYPPTYRVVVQSLDTPNNGAGVDAAASGTTNQQSVTAAGQGTQTAGSTQPANGTQAANNTQNAPSTAGHSSQTTSVNELWGS